MTIEEIKKVPADSIVVMTPHWFASRILTLPPEQFKNIQLTSVHEFGSIGHIGTTKILVTPIGLAADEIKVLKF